MSVYIYLGVMIGSALISVITSLCLSKKYFAAYYKSKVDGSDNVACLYSSGDKRCECNGKEPSRDICVICKEKWSDTKDNE